MPILVGDTPELPLGQGRIGRVLVDPANAPFPIYSL